MTPEKHAAAQDLEGWLALWRESQGGAGRDADIERLAAALPFDPEDEIHVLDLFCGPGDLARAVRARFPRARLDCVDRDPFLLALCVVANRARGIEARTVLADAWARDWTAALRRDYHAIVAANSLHWFDLARLETLLSECRALLRPGGVMAFLEPSAPTFADAAREPAWRAFWARAAAALGRDHFAEVTTRGLAGKDVIDDAGLTPIVWGDALARAGFAGARVLWSARGHAAIMGRLEGEQGGKNG